MFEEPKELPPETEKPLSEILTDLDTVLGPLSEEDEGHRHQATLKDAQSEVRGLREEAEELLDTLRSGIEDPGVLNRLEEVRRGLLEAQADEIDKRDTPSGNQPPSV